MAWYSIFRNCVGKNGVFASLAYHTPSSIIFKNALIGCDVSKSSWKTFFFISMPAAVIRLYHAIRWFMLLRAFGGIFPCVSWNEITLFCLSVDQWPSNIDRQPPPYTPSQKTVFVRHCQPYWGTYPHSHTPLWCVHPPLKCGTYIWW